MTGLQSFPEHVIGTLRKEQSQAYTDNFIPVLSCIDKRLLPRLRNDHSVIKRP